MALRAMNNTEKANAKILKENGFTVFWQDRGIQNGDYWAIHHKLKAQYHIGTTTNEAIIHLIKATTNQQHGNP